MKKLVSMLMVIVMLAVVTACGNTNTEEPTKTQTTTETSNSESTDSGDTSAAAESTGFAGELELMHFSTSEESEGNGGSDGFRTMIANWEAANTDVELVQNVLANDEYKAQIAALAAAGDLPDVFLLQGMNTKAWVEQGLILDMTQIVADSPYSAQYDMSLFYPFIYEGKTYGIPALTGGTCAVVAYDSALWAEAGFDTFPETWEGVIEADKYFDEMGIDVIAFGNSGQWQINSCFLSTVGNRFTGADWTHSIIEKGGAKFTDQPFVDALAFTQDIFASGVFNKDFNAVNNEDAREYYIAGDAAAFIGGNWDISYVNATILGEPLHENTKFAVIPQPEGATAAYNTHDIGMGFAVAINANLADEPEKLAAAIDLAYSLTGEEFSEYVASNYALSGITKIENVDLSKFDRFTREFYNYSYVDNNACDIYDSYVSGAVWSVLNQDLQTMLNGDITPEEVAANVQKAYEDNY